MTATDMIIATPIGAVTLSTSGEALISIALKASNNGTITTPLDPMKLSLPDSVAPFSVSVAKQLFGYFNDPHYQFEIAVVRQGTQFQRKVWHFLTKIPVGTTLTYGELAKKLESGPRAVANACRKNPTPIVVPCHRIIAANGLGGFAGQSQGALLDIKRSLLQHEGAI